jgi:cellulose synthase (UDP-forming)
MFFLSGWTLMMYMSLPVIAILTGVSPIQAKTAGEFLVHFGPYWGLALLNVAISGGGSYTFSAFTLLSANFWVYVLASLKVALRRPGRFAVTPKEAVNNRQLRAVAPALIAIAVLTGSSAYGMASASGPAMLNNVAFALVHISVLAAGVWPALHRKLRAQTELPAKDMVRKTVA